MDSIPNLSLSAIAYPSIRPFCSGHVTTQSRKISVTVFLPDGSELPTADSSDFQELDKTVNVLFGGLPNRWAQKATRREVLSIEPAVPTPLRWSEVPITFSRADQWTSFSEPGRFPLVLKPVVAGSVGVLDRQPTKGSTRSR
jgi:hypothetical protein